MEPSGEQPKKSAHPKTSTEIDLETVVFGQVDKVIKDLRQRDSQGKTECREKLKCEPAWKDEDDNDNEILHTKPKKKKKKISTDTSTKSYAKDLRDRYVSLVGKPSWADLNAKDKKTDSDDEDDPLLSSVGDFQVRSSSLPRTIINVKQRSNLTEDSHGLGKISNTAFHPHAQVALVAGSNRKIGLFQVDGIRNPLIQDIVFDKFSITCGRFTTSGDEIIATSSSHRFFYTYNMIAGKTSKLFWNRDLDGLCARSFYLSPDGRIMLVPGKAGYIHMFSATTKEWLHSAKMNSDVEALTFNTDGSRMFSHSATGEVYVWDSTTRDCIHRFHDDGCVQGTSIAMSPNQQYLACGSSSGVVNIYETNTLLNKQYPRPIKVILNLKTSVTQLKFNCTSEILAFSSPFSNTGLRLAHFPTMSVFSNFPKPENVHGAATSLDISSNSGFLAVGTIRGSTHLFRLMHYGNY